MSVTKPIFTVLLSAAWAPVLITATLAAAAAKHRVERRARVFFFIPVSMSFDLMRYYWCCPFRCAAQRDRLHPEQFVQHRHLRFEFPRAEMLDDVSVLHH